MAEYNPFQDLNPQFSYYTAPPLPKVNSVIKDDLFGDIDLPGYEVGKDGNILAPANTPKAQEYNYNNLMNEMAATHGEQRQYVQEQSPTTQKSTTKQDLKGDKKHAMEFFQSKGLSPHQAAGIVGNLMVESSLNTTIKGDKGQAFGIAQWHPDRQKGLKLLAQKRGTDISDLDTQLEYVWEELNNNYKFALNKILNSRNTKEATTAFMLHYEKPGIPHFEKRLKEAELLLS